MDFAKTATFTKLVISSQVQVLCIIPEQRACNTKRKVHSQNAYSKPPTGRRLSKLTLGRFGEYITQKKLRRIQIITNTPKISVKICNLFPKNFIIKAKFWGIQRLLFTIRVNSNPYVKKSNSRSPLNLKYFCKTV